MIYTSYFSNLKNIKGTGVSISRYSPKWFGGCKYSKLAPTVKILTEYKNNLINEEQYIYEYIKNVLNRLDAKKIYEELNSIDEDVTLLCYEKRDEFCHRHLVKHWLEYELSINVEEL